MIFFVANDRTCSIHLFRPISESYQLMRKSKLREAPFMIRFFFKMASSKPNAPPIKNTSVFILSLTLICMNSASASEVISFPCSSRGHHVVIFFSASQEPFQLLFLQIHFTHHTCIFRHRDLCSILPGNILGNAFGKVFDGFLY